MAMPPDTSQEETISTTKAPPSGRRPAPRELLPGLIALVDSIPDGEIVRLASGAFGKGGFRQNTKPALIRANVKNFIAPGKELSPSFLLALRRNCLLSVAIQLLSPRAVKSNFDDLASVCGAGRALAAVWLDERDEVSGFALQKMPSFLGENPAPLPTRDEALARLRDTLDPVFSAFGVSAPDGSEDPARAEALKAEVASLKSENRRLRDFEDRYTRAAQRERDLDADAKALRARLDAARRDFNAEAARANAAEAEVRKLRDDAEGSIAAEVERRTAAAFAGLLARRSAVESEVAADAGADILARASAALENQRQADATSGTFSALRRRLDEIEGMLSRVQDALVDAIHPLPSLQKARAELAAESHRLRELLGENNLLNLDSPFASALAAATGSAGADTLQPLAGTIEHLASIGALGGDEADHLRFILRMRQDLLHATTAPAARGDSGSAKNHAGDPFGILASALRGETSAIVLVDGHNTLFALQSRYLGDGEGQKPTAAAREKLVADFRRIAGGHPTVRAWIVFDGDTASESAAGDNVRVSYSGGTGEHRADKVLVANARFFALAKAENILIVTNDNGLAGEAEKAGARRLPPGHLIPLL